MVLFMEYEMSRTFLPYYTFNHIFVISASISTGSNKLTAEIQKKIVCKQYSKLPNDGAILKTPTANLRQSKSKISVP